MALAYCSDHHNAYILTAGYSYLKVPLTPTGAPPPSFGAIHLKSWSHCACIRLQIFILPLDIPANLANGMNNSSADICFWNFLSTNVGTMVWDFFFAKGALEIQVWRLCACHIVGRLGWCYLFSPFSFLFLCYYLFGHLLNVFVM